MKDTALPRKETPKDQRPKKRHDDSWARLLRICRETKPAGTESDSRWVSLQQDEQIGSEYWLG